MTTDLLKARMIRIVEDKRQIFVNHKLTCGATIERMLEQIKLTNKEDKAMSGATIVKMSIMTIQ